MSCLSPLFFLLRHLSIFLWEVCPKPKKRIRKAFSCETVVVRRACRSVDHRANKNNDGRQSHLRAHSKSNFFEFRTNGKKRRENTERRAERGVQKRQKESAERITHRRSIHSFVVFDGPKKKKISASFFLVVFGFLPPEFLRHSLPAILLIAMRCVAIRSGERNKNAKRENKKPFISDLSLDETTR